MKSSCALKKKKWKNKSTYIYCSLHFLFGEKYAPNSVLVSVKVTCCFYMLEILFWPWLVLRKGWFNFSEDALLVLLGWPAGLNTSFIYEGLVLLQNLNDIELIICFEVVVYRQPINLFKFFLSYMRPIIQI